MPDPKAGMTEKRVDIQLFTITTAAGATCTVQAVKGGDVVSFSMGGQTIALDWEAIDNLLDAISRANEWRTTLKESIEEKVVPRFRRQNE